VFELLFLGVTYWKTYLPHMFQISSELGIYNLLSGAWILPGTIDRATVRVPHPVPTFLLPYLQKKSFDTRKNIGPLL
jgi:hypothetical protein